MTTELIVILVHQLLFQGMFFAKNILLRRRIQKQIRGWNKEATVSIVYFFLFICTSVAIASSNNSAGNIELLNRAVIYSLSTILLIINLVISLMSLLHLHDSWRVGVIEEQKTELITTGIYSHSRNPYFVSYIIMFIAYAVLTQNYIVAILAIIGFFLVHWMILREENYLKNVHGEQYVRYLSEVPRYLLF